MPAARCLQSFNRDTARLFLDTVCLAPRGTAIFTSTTDCCGWLEVTIIIMYQTPKLKFGQKVLKKSYVKKHICHQQFLNILQTKQITKSQFRTFRSKNHTAQTVEITKTCLNAFDVTRYILDDGIETLAYGHYQISP